MDSRGKRSPSDHIPGKSDLDQAIEGLDILVCKAVELGLLKAAQIGITRRKFLSCNTQMIPYSFAMEKLKISE
ncbi:hypothetical protein ACS0TY_005332 [Phlomoides rotata]